MPSGSADSPKPIIFISYAHADEPEKPGDQEVQWLSFVMKFLRPAVKYGEFRIWVDPQIPAGTPWDPDIGRHLQACSVFVLLVSANSMASDYIIDKELAIARERQATGALEIYPLLIEATPKAGLARVSDLTVRPPGLKPLQSYSLADRNQHMSDAADEIGDMASAMAKRLTAAADLKMPDLLTPEIAGIAEAIEGRQGIVGPATKGELRPQRPAVLDIGALPETGYERLVGRDVELKRLDDAWSDGKTNVISLIAEGGAGKSALVNEWLSRLQADNYRGATVVLGWSFFSQGSKERATSADEFLNWALTKLSVTLTTTSASAKGEAIAEAMLARRALLVLDGVEPLQHGPGPQAGQLKDQGLRALLRRCASASAVADHSLIVLTSRVAVADIQRFKDGAAPIVDVGKLSEAAGAELLRDNDVWGIEADLRSASRDFAGHPLALTLLASFLKETQNGDVRRRDHLRGILADVDNPRHDQARRVMESYEKEWLADQPILLAVLHCVGLFDRPASGDCLEALRATSIDGLTDAIVDLSAEQWRRAAARLREVRLLAPVDPSDPEALDAHPLVREWFGERLKRTNETAWKAAHSRLYDHLRDTTHEGEKPTLAELAPLFHAIAHGCRAGRHKEALEEVYSDRVCRRHPDGAPYFYASQTLGAQGSNLAAISWFFDKPYETPSVKLTPPDRAWILSVASFGLRTQGRLREALSGMRAGLQMEEAAQDWLNAAISASNRSRTELLVGDIAAATVSAEKSVAHADRSGNTWQMLARRAHQAEALLAAGNYEKAGDLFADAEHRLRKWNPENPLLNSVRGYQYCDLLLSQRRAAEARDRAARTLQWARQFGGPLEVGLDTLMLGRAHRALSSPSLAQAPSSEQAQAYMSDMRAWLGEAIESLRSSGQNDYVACGLLARAAFRRAVGDWDGAARDLDEAQEIAEPGPMRLYLCDIALERARLALTQREALSPLAGFLEPNPPLAALPDAAEANAFAERARAELDVARKLITDCGYHRRDEELAELDDVMAGRRPFADLPPRV